MWPWPRSQYVPRSTFLPNLPSPPNTVIGQIQLEARKQEWPRQGGAYFHQPTAVEGWGVDLGGTMRECGLCQEEQAPCHLLDHRKSFPQTPSLKTSVAMENLLGETRLSWPPCYKASDLCWLCPPAWFLHSSASVRSLAVPPMAVQVFMYTRC